MSDLVKVRINVTETLYHRGTIEIDKETLMEWENMDEDLLSEVIGDYCSRNTLDDGMWEYGEFEVV